MSTQVETASVAEAGGVTEMTYREAVRAALADELAGDPLVMMMGEDVANAGGVFKTNEGLPEEFPGRIVNTPICENTFVGVAIGMAVTGMRPIVEIMFSDFLPTAADAIVEELPKLRFMSGGQCTIPVTVRSIGGAGGGFGTQHSATGESWFMGLPGLKVASAGTPGAAYSVLRAAIRDDDPVLFFEHKAMYGRKGQVARGAIAQIGKASVERAGDDVTIVSSLLMTDRSLAAAEQLAADGIEAEVIDLRWMRPLDIDTIRASVARTGRLVIAEEQVHDAGWGATIVSRLVMDGVALKAPPRAVSLPDDLLVSYSPPLEAAIIPSADAIASAVRGTVAA
ncbi:MAG: acetoin:2,6-dichlorophenolindophenol oxidoreductase subunit beta [Solirubrobacteraceae bacterium]